MLSASLPVGSQFSSAWMNNRDKALAHASRYWRKNSSQGRRPISQSNRSAASETKMPVIAISCEPGKSTKPCALFGSANTINTMTTNAGISFFMGITPYLYDNSVTYGRIRHLYFTPKSRRFADRFGYSRVTTRGGKVVEQLTNFPQLLQT